jgi:hypothetical protein
MAMTKAEAAKLTNDLLLRGVIETIINESSILLHLPFEDVVGTAITYNRENAAPTVDWYDVGDTWTESTPTFTQVTTALKTLGGDADVDHFLQQTYRNPNDLEAEVIALKSKAVAYEWSQSFYTGDTAVNAKAFDGIRKLMPAGQEIAIATNGGALTLDKLDELIDLVKPGRPDALCMSKRTRRKLSSLRRASGNLLETDVDAFGRRALYYDGLPILVDDLTLFRRTMAAFQSILNRAIFDSLIPSGSRYTVPSIWSISKTRRRSCGVACSIPRAMSAARA